MLNPDINFRKISKKSCYCCKYFNFEAGYDDHIKCDKHNFSLDYPGTSTVCDDFKKA